MGIESVDPTTGETIRSYDTLSAEELTGCLERSREAFQEWRRVGLAGRGELLARAAELLRDGKEEHARLMAREMGKPLGEGRAEAEKCAWVCDYYAEHGEEFLADQPVSTDAAKSYVSFQPLGPVLAVMPWNFPFWQVFRFAAPGVMAGNTCLLKHASNVPGCALAIQEIFRRAGFPEGVFQTLLVGTDAVSRILRHPAVRAVTLTGSSAAGRAVASEAGEQLKKSVLELGGSDPYVLLEDADLDRAVEACVDSRLINSGQSCIAAKRFIVPASLLESFEERMVARMKGVHMGNPLAEETQVGPLARHNLRRDLHRQVRDSVAAGARCLLGGEIPAGPGAFYPPTVLTDVVPGMPAYEEELFGPVAAILPVDSEDEALEVANDSPFGLGAAVFTRDRERGETIARERLEAGCCFVNDLVRSDPRLPFGGVKESGYGRELSVYGMREFVNVKTVFLGGDG